MAKKVPQKTDTFIIIIFFIILMCILIYIKIRNDTDNSKIAEEQRATIFSSVDQNTNVNVTKYTIYGTHFNLEGTIDIIDISGITVNYVDLIVKTLTGDEISISSDFNYSDNTISFSTSSEINDGVDLEGLSIDEYYILLKITYSNSDIKYYSLINASEYEDTTYYTITKNNSNNKIDIAFNQYNNIPYMSISVTEIDELPDDVYDVAIDPGHGGLDAGATSGNYTEAELVLESSLILKEKLENLGLKVFLSRDENSSETEDTAYNMYDDNGRINILNESHAKLIISLHLNSNEYDVDIGGIEVYAPNDCNLDFASLLAQNIVEYANTYYSELTSYKKLNGVYVRNFTNADILAFKTKATKGGYEPYDITTSTPYLYIIRETGGISTNAFVDGRNTIYGTNKYYNSNIGIETYLIELAYMIVQEDLNNFIENSNLYMEGIVASIQEYYNL